MTSEVRSVTVRLDADVAAYIAKMTAAGKATDAAFSSRSRDAGIQSSTKSLGGLQTQAQRTSPALRDVDVNLNRVNTAAGRAGPAVDRLSGRMRIFADLIAMIGPGLIPIAAVGIPAITGLAAAAAAGAAAGGSMLIAFQGIGDAVKAIDAYQLDRTPENLEKMDVALQNLGPHAQAFVMRFNEFQPVLRELRDSAAAGWFPGLIESLDNIERIAPQVQDLLYDVSRAGSEALAEGTESLTTERWLPFLDFLDVELPATITKLGHIMGDLSHGAAEMWMAFDPGNDAFIDWVRDIADGFDDWASSAEGRADIRSFLDYVRETGPQVGDFAGSVVDMFVQITQAAAPLGGPVLEILTAVADVVANIADSDLGTPIFTMLAAVTALNRVLMITGRLWGPAMGGAAAGAAARGGMFAGITSARTGLRGLRTDFNTLLDPMNKFGRNTVAVAAATERMRGRMVAAGKAGALIAGLALITSDLGDNMGLTNTASLALMGSMAGPWGAALGGAAGYVIDLTSANDDLVASIEAAENAASMGSLADYRASLAGVGDELDKLKQSKEDRSFLGSMPLFGEPLEQIGDFIKGQQIEEGEKQLAALENQLANTEGAAAALGRELGMTIGPLDGSARSTRELEEVLTRAQPAMDQLGISTAQLRTAFAAEQGTDIFSQLKAGLDPENYDLDTLTGKIREFYEQLESPAGRLNAVGSALRGLGDDSVTLSEKAQLVGDALSAYMDPANNAEAATHALREQFVLLRDTLDSDYGFGEMTRQGRENAAMTRDYAEAIQAQMTTMVAAGASEKDLARALNESRNQFIESGVAAGFSADQMRARARAIGLTPKLVETVFKALHVDEWKNAVGDARKIIRDIPKDVVTELRTNGVPQTTAQVNALLDKYDLTEKQRRAVLRLVDLASDDIGAVLEALAKAEKPRKSKLTADVGAARNDISGVLALLNRYRSKSVTLTTNVVTNQIANKPKVGGPDQESADGGTILGQRYPYGDKVLIHAAPGEEIISNRHGEADQFRRDRAAGRIPHYADGGTIATYASTRFVRGYANGGNVESYIGGGPNIGSVFESFADTLRFWLREQRRDLMSRQRLLEKEVAAREKAYRDAQQQRRDLVDALVGRLTQSVWGGEQADIGTLSLDQVLTTAADQAAIPGLVKQLEGRLSAGTLEALRKQGNVDQLTALVHATDEQLDRFEAAWEQIQTAADPLVKLEQQINEIRQLDNLERNLRAMGLSDEAFRDLLTTASIEEITALLQRGREDVLRYQALFELRQQEAQEFAGGVGDSEFGELIKATREDWKESRKHLKNIDERLEETNERLDKVAKAAGVEGPERFADALNDRGGKAARKNGRPGG